MIIDEYQQLLKTIKDYQRISKTIKEYQRLSKTIKDYQMRNASVTHAYACYACVLRSHSGVSEKYMFSMLRSMYI